MNDPVYAKALQIIDDQTRSLGGSDPLTPRQIHDLRVATKQLRACLRLYDAVRSKTDVKRIDQLVKVTANSFAGMRDSHVQVKMLNKILRGQPHVMLQTAPLYKTLESGKLSERSPDLRLVAESFHTVIEQWQQSLACDESGFVLRGLENTYEKARKFGKRALKKDVDENFHQWRKWEKYWLYQLDAISATSTKKALAYRDKLSSLGSKLGRFNDYCVLESTVRKEVVLFEDERAAGLILNRIDEEKQALKTIFRTSYSRLFRESFKTLWSEKLGNRAVFFDEQVK